MVFVAAGQGDAVAQGIVDRQADELVAMVVSAVRRLRLTRRDVDVVLGGGVFAGGDGGFTGRIVDGVHAVAPAARVARLARAADRGRGPAGLRPPAGRGRAPPDASASRPDGRAVQAGRSIKTGGVTWLASS